MTNLILHTLLSVSLLIVLVLLTRRAVARHFGPRMAYALWLLPFARLIMPGIDLPRSWIPFMTRPEPVAETPVMSAETIRAYLMTAETNMPVEAAATPFPWILTLTGLWCAGFAVGLTWLVMNQRRHKARVNQDSMPAAPSLNADIIRASRMSGLRKTPSVRVSLTDEGPYVSGLVRPVIILPRDFEERFRTEQRRLALLHEMLHVKRGDLWTASAMMIFRLANWPNPIVHWAWPRFRADQEAACDASVLRCTGEASRSEYAETLLSAAKTSGRASPISGTGLTLSLNHPVKERLMTLGSNNTPTRKTTRWALGALLLTGTAISAPLSFADDPQTSDVQVETIIETPVKTQTTTKNVTRWMSSDDESGEHKGFEIREEDGVKTYLRVSRNGTTETLTREELAAEYGEDFDKVDTTKRIRMKRVFESEPRLKTHTVVINSHDKDKYEMTVEDGKRTIYKVSEDGTKTLINEDELGGIAGSNISIDVSDGRFPGLLELQGDERKVIVVETDGTSTWSTGGNNDKNVFFMGLNSEMGSGSNASRLHSAKSMLEMSTRMLEDVQEEADGTDRDLRNAEKELEKARKALEKAMAAMEKSAER